QRRRPRREPPDGMDGQHRPRDAPVRDHHGRAGPRARQAGSHGRGRAAAERRGWRRGRTERRAMTALRMTLTATRTEGEGSSAPPGPPPWREGVTFGVSSRHATGIELLLFDGVDDAQAARVIRFDPAANHTYHYWHVFVPDLRPGQIYGYRVEGPSDHARGLRFDRNKVLLDPDGRGVVVPDGYRRAAAAEKGDNTPAAMKSVVVDPSAYDWEGDAPLRHPSARTIVYEMHVRGFTRHPSSGVGERTRGTYA